MVIPQIKLSKVARNELYTLSISMRNPTKVNEVLKQYILTSLKRLRTAMQLTFIKDCIKENLCTKRIRKMVPKHYLSISQREKLIKVMMRNLRNDIYKDLAQKNKNMNETRNEMASVCSEEEKNKLITCWRTERDKFITRIKKHFDSRKKWFQTLKDKDYVINTPEVIDGIIMNDCDVPRGILVQPTVYGDVALTEQEKEIMRLPPKYTVYQHPKRLPFLSELEKTFMKLRRSATYDESVTQDAEESPTLDMMYSYEDNNVDFQRVKATDVPFTRSVMIPPAANDEMEAKIQYAKYELDKVVKKYESQKRNINLSECQKEGLSSLKKKIQEGSIVVYPTDKTGKLAIESPESYRKAMEEHVKNARESTYQEYGECEKLLNAHMQAWSNIFDVKDRVCHTFQAKNNEVPPMYGLRKDHKTGYDIDIGPPARPVCGAVVSANYRISTFASMILKPFIDETEETCDSTEDMLSRIQETNEGDLTGYIIGSFDVDALYPSIDVDVAVEGCKILMQESTIEFTNCDIKEVGLYLSVNMTKDELIKEDVLSYCPTRNVPGRFPKIIGVTKERNKQKRWKGWKVKKENTPHNVEKKMTILAIGHLLKVLMRNHVFTFDKKLYIQTSGGAIGVGIAGDICKLYMVYWDRQLKRELEFNNISYRLYTRYVDDGLVVIRDSNNADSTEKELMSKLKEIANCIEPSIQVKVDYPSENTNGRLPALDTEIWIEEVEIGDGKQRKILHSHYDKPFSNKLVIMKNSAMSFSKKINILVNDLVRVMRNVSRLCSTTERKRKIQHYMLRLQISGYDVKDRGHIYKKAKARYDVLLGGEEQKTIPLYRNKFWQKKERVKARNEKRKSWFKKNGDKATFFVEATPEQALKDECQKVIRQCGLSIKVIEKSGATLKKSLVKSDPFKVENCGRDNCAFCSIIQGGTCRTRDIVYLGECEDAELEDKPEEARYYGETGRSGRERIEEHLRKYESGDKDSTFCDHMIQKHNGEKKKIRFKVVSRCPNDALLRQATEAVYIRELNPGLNRKEEFGFRRGHERQQLH